MGIGLYKAVANRGGGLILSGMLLAAGAAEAAERHHEAHEHGRATMNVAVEGATLEIEFISPSANIVGFEHKPATDDDRKAVRAAIDALKSPVELFAFPADAACRLKEAEVESGQLETDHHDEKDHGHGKKGSEHGGEEGHSEFHAHYHFSCRTPAALRHLDILIFKRFPAIEELDVRAAGPKGQTAGELTHEAPRLTF